MGIKIIAEIAQGFEGCPVKALLLMKAASFSGADAAKYQLVYADELATPDYLYYDFFRSLEMSDAEWRDLSKHARELGIGLQFDVFGAKSLKLAIDIGADAIKLHGTDIANIGLLNEVAKSGVSEVLLGGGGAYLDELILALNILAGKRVILLLGFQGYPTPNEANQISRMCFFSEKFSLGYPNLSIGFADHTPQDSGLSYALAATAIGAGAKVIEKHLTLGRNMRMEDCESALNPDEFQIFTQTMRGCSEALGVSSQADNFQMSEAELNYRKVIRRHVVAGRDIQAGSNIDPIDLVLKRTSSESFITDLESVYKKRLKRSVSINSPITIADID